MIDTIRQATGDPIRIICAVQELPRSSRYHAAKPNPCQRADVELGAVVEAIFRGAPPPLRLPENLRRTDRHGPHLRSRGRQAVNEIT